MLTYHKKEKRRFYRHPVSVPLTLRTAENKREGRAESLDVSLEGLSFLWSRKLPKGEVVDVNAAVKDNLFDIKSRVAYAKEDPITGKFRTGVCFTDYPGDFMARLVEEMLDGLQHRKQLSRELGREIPEEDAASHWLKNTQRDLLS